MLKNFQTIIKEGVFTTDGAANHANDVLTDTLAIALADAMPPDSPATLRGELVSLRILDEDDQGQPMDVVVLKANQSLGTKNAAVSISDANARDIIGHVSLTSYIDLINSQQAQGDFQPIPFELATVNLYLSIITRGAPTHTANGLRVQVGVRLHNKEMI